MPERPSQQRINVVARAHYGVRPEAFQHWNDAQPRMQAGPAGAGDSEILLYGLILPHEEVAFLRDCFGDETAMSGKMFRDALEAIEGDVTLRINSDGGDVFEASMMLQAMRERQEAGHSVNAVIDGIAASAASLLAAGANECVIAELGFVMIHEPSGGMYGRAADLETGAKLLRDMTDSTAGVYAEKTGKDADEIRAMMAAETYLNAADAVDQGFADRAVKVPKASDDDDAGRAAMTRRNERLSAVLAATSIHPS